MAIAVADFGAIFFGLLGAAAGRALAFLGAAQWTALVTVALLGCSFAMACWLPQHTGIGGRRVVAPDGYLAVSGEARLAMDASCCACFGCALIQATLSWLRNTRRNPYLRNGTELPDHDRADRNRAH